MGLAATTLTIVLTFICTGVAANWLVQRWQYRNWLNQQKFLGAEKSYEALKLHSEEIARIASRRLSSMFRLVFSLDQGSERLEERRKIYSDCIDEWNQSINIFYARTTMYLNFDMTKRLEDDINARFVEIGARIEKLIKERVANPNVSLSKIRVLDDLYALQGVLGNFNRDMLRHVINRRASTYQGVNLKYDRRNLQYFSTWQLFKALFITRIEEFSVTLTAFELEPPARRLD